MFLIKVIAVVLIYLFLTNSIFEFSSGDDEGALQRVDSAIRNACVTCYACEGSYPENFEYLQRNYNLKIDLDKYIVHYEVFGQNIMPDITVMRNLS